MELKTGDIFFQTSGNLLDTIINFFQSLWSGDRRSIFSHVGVVVDDSGTTLETSEWETGLYDLSSRQGRKTLVAVYRCQRMSFITAADGFREVGHLVGRTYPYWRLPLFALGLAKLLHGSNMVCSELACHFLNAAGVRSGPAWGINVDQLIDEIYGAAGWDLVYINLGWEA